MADNTVQAAVREKGGTIAESVTTAGKTSCCGPVACCGGDSITSDLYSDAKKKDLPSDAVAASLGCGNPTALLSSAHASRSETAVDRPRTIVFACVHNAGRSQMAASFFNALADPRKAARSAGTAPGEHVHAEVVTAMREVGIDVSTATPRQFTPELAEGTTWLVTMGCGESCPVVPGTLREDWPIADPAGQPLARVRQIRDGDTATRHAVRCRPRPALNPRLNVLSSCCSIDTACCNGSPSTGRNTPTTNARSRHLADLAAYRVDAGRS